MECNCKRLDYRRGTARRAVSVDINQFIKQKDRSATYIDMHEIDIEIA